jgi:hypothetical protein
MDEGTIHVTMLPSLYLGGIFEYVDSKPKL